MESRTASAMNWPTMSERCAPIALRMPISRVRSVTETSMMFMTPIPPTSSEIAATAPRRTVNVRLVSFVVWRSDAWLRMRKLLEEESLLALEPELVWVLASTVSISLCAESTALEPVAWTTIWEIELPPAAVSRTAVIGAMATSS